MPGCEYPNGSHPACSPRPRLYARFSEKGKELNLLEEALSVTGSMLVELHAVERRLGWRIWRPVRPGYVCMTGYAVMHWLPVGGLFGGEDTRSLSS